MIPHQERPAGHSRRSLWLRKPSLRLLIIALIVELVLPFVGSALFVAIRLSDAEHAKDKSQHLGIARAFSSEVDRQLLNAEAALNALATSPELRNDDLATFYRQSATVADQHGARGGPRGRRRRSSDLQYRATVRHRARAPQRSGVGASPLLPPKRPKSRICFAERLQLII